MTDNQRELLKKFMRDNARKDSSSMESARRKLIDEGIYKEDGELRPEFGGVGHGSERTVSFL